MSSAGSPRPRRPPAPPTRSSPRARWASSPSSATTRCTTALTGLPNRALFLDRLELSLKRSRRQGGEFCCAVLFCDLDRFKLVNDSLGHIVGDRLLMAVAKRIEGALRPGDTVARHGGDEFTLLLEDIGDVRGASIVAERVQESLAAPFHVDNRELYVSASIGIALVTPDRAPGGRGARRRRRHVPRQGQGRRDATRSSTRRCTRA